MNSKVKEIILLYFYIFIFIFYFYIYFYFLFFIFSVGNPIKQDVKKGKLREFSKVTIIPNLVFLF